MKKTYFLLLIGLASACTNNFIELYPETELSEGHFYKSEEEFILLANGCHVPLRNLEKVDHWVMAELPSDNASFQYSTVTGEASKGVIDQFILAANNVAYSSFWNTSYNGITRANKLLYEIDRADIIWSTDALRERTIGEARFLRALYYFNLVRQFGEIPLVLDPITPNEALTKARVTEDEVYASIIEDLPAAAAHFKAANEVTENGRASEGAAMGLLGKVYLTTHQYALAESALTEVIDLGKYSLLPVYDNLFNAAAKDFKETIFAVQYSEASVELSNRFIFWFAPWSSGGEVTNRPNINLVGGGWNQPTDDLINAFEAGDKRKEASIAYWTGKDWDSEVRPIPYCHKFKAPLEAPDDRTGDNMPILRYSDILLMYAEALNQQDKTAEAIPFVQQVRERAGLTNSLSGLNSTRLATLIAKERQVEFCFENQRWYDLKRTERALDVLKAHGVREKALKPFLYTAAFEMGEFKLLAPIPEQQVVLINLSRIRVIKS